MATNTTNYGFKKPDESDFYDVQDQNNNWDLADGALKELDTPTFEDYTGETEVPAAATALENIKSKGKLATLLSNIKAFCRGCITLAMLVNDTATNNSQLPVSSAVTHDLQQQLNVLNTKLTIKSKIFSGINTGSSSSVSFYLDNAESIVLALSNGGDDVFCLRSHNGAKWVFNYHKVIIRDDTEYYLVKSFNKEVTFTVYYL